MVIVAHLPIRSGLRTTMSSRVPARRCRSNVRSRATDAACAKRRTGQERPRQRTVTEMIFVPDDVADG